MLDHVLPPDIEDERHLRLHRRNIGEVLFGPDTKIHTARLAVLLEPWNDILELQFIRHVLESEGTALFGKIGDHFPVRVIRKLTRKSVGGFVRRNGEEKCR